MSASNGPDNMSSQGNSPSPGSAPGAPQALCAECGLLYASAQMLDFCDQCGAPRCRNCAARANDDEGGVYICSNCADALDASGGSGAY
ncbi:MAG TPA: hypothetical protein VF808_03740 [Ktedonobacterales bacterium]